MEETDTLDKNKSRGILIGYSASILALYYLNADLSTLKLLGNEIKLQSNINSIWLILALVNLYLTTRYIQKLPDDWWKFDNQMNAKYDSILKKINKVFLGNIATKNLKESIARLHEHQKNLKSSEFKITSTKYKKPYIPSTENSSGGKIYRLSDEEHQKRLNQVSRSEIILEVEVTYIADFLDETKIFSNDHVLKILPSSRHIWLAIFLTLATGSIHRPWFFDTVAPIILGCVSLTFATLKWAEINSIFL